MVTASFKPDHIRHTGHRNRVTRRDDRQIAFSHIPCLQRLFRYFFNHVIGIPWIRNQMGVNATKKMVSGVSLAGPMVQTIFVFGRVIPKMVLLLFQIYAGYIFHNHL